MTITRTQFTTAEVSVATGATERQLQWWDEQGILSPTRDGHKRLYSAAQADLVGKLVKLRSAGMWPRRAIKLLTKHPIVGQVLVVRGKRETMVTL